MNEKIVQALLEEIQLPDSAYEQSEERYDSLSKWLGNEKSGIKEYEPQVQPQGSFRLGTAVKPQKEKDAEYDLDLTNVCKKGLNPKNITQHQLRELVAKELNSYAMHYGLKNVEEKNRCCRLNYQSSAVDACSFHMDIVPSIPATEKTQTNLLESYRNFSVQEVGLDEAVHAVFITDKRRTDYDQYNANWLLSNPEGYALWFEKRMQTNEQRTILFSEYLKKVTIPAWKRKSVLQKIVQLLKWHRDVMFADDDDGKPISIIITTLAAKSYRGNSILCDALKQVLDGLIPAINTVQPYVPNPVNPEEDFADKWDQQKYQCFHLKENCYKWIRKAQCDFGVLLSEASSLKEAQEVLHDSFRYDPPTDVLIRCFSNHFPYDDRLDRRYVIVLANHRQSIVSQWSLCINSNFHVGIDAYYGSSEKYCYTLFSSGKPLCKGLKLKFLVNTNFPPPCEVWWQVGNMGEEALNHNCLRGGFYQSDYLESGRGLIGRKEETSFYGTHWVQCLIIKDGKCVGRSQDFVVKIE